MVDDSPRREPSGADTDRGVGAYDTIEDATPHPMIIVTAADKDGTPAGCLVGFHTRCSVHPVRHIVCISTVNRTFEVARQAQYLTVHRLNEQHQSLARLFGEHTGHDIDKFARVSWHEGPQGTPLLDAIDSRWTGYIFDTARLGDHWGFVVEPIEGDIGPDLNEPSYPSTEASVLKPGHPLG